jgi:sulfite reductase (ferredoxin)
MFQLPKKVIIEEEKFKKALEDFLNGKMNPSFFRGIRVPWGFYSQRGGKLLMARLRIPAGIITPEGFRAIGKTAEEFANGVIHITTRQDIQIHNLPYENSIKVIESLRKYNLSPRGGGGNTVRNITACPLSGICGEERIEVYKYAIATTEYILNLDESVNLPRKFKISFSGCLKDCAFSGVNDMGFIAINGGFKILCGGGMGAKSSVGRVLEESINPEDAIYSLKAVLNIYNKFGDRKNRHHNRLRFFIQDNGWDRFVRLYREELRKVKEEEFIPLNLDHNLPELKDEGGELEIDDLDFLKFNVGRQKQSGYYYITVRVPKGDLTSKEAIAISNLSEIVPHLIIRTTQRQNLILSNIPSSKVKEVYKKLKEIFGNRFLYPDTGLDILCCKGALTCNLGLCNSQGLAEEIERELWDIKERVLKIENLKININGCPNACGQHPIGIISLSGLTRKVYNRTMPFYRIHIGGRVAQENTILAEEIGSIPARAVPKAMKELVVRISEEINDRSLEEFLSEKGRKIAGEVVKKYSYVPAIEEDRSYYIDFGKNEVFSLEGLSQGECGAGVIDMIEADLGSAKQTLSIAKEKNYSIEEIKSALLYSARALLVLKGIDPKTDEEIISSFVHAFVRGGIARRDFINLKEFYEKLTRKEVDGMEAYNYVSRLFEDVKEIYSLMDSNFNLPVRFKKDEEEVKKISSTIYDLRGTPCPINFVKAKLKLEGMQDGEILELFLDDGEPIRNVPKSLENEGHKIEKIEQVENYYRVVVIKSGGKK